MFPFLKLKQPHMKQVVILRHGKAEQNTMDIDDYDRALTARGVKNANDMGVFISRKIGVPDLILTSSAKRAYQTAHLVSQSIGYPTEQIESDQNLYFAPSRWILNVISKLRLY